MRFGQFRKSCWISRRRHQQATCEVFQTVRVESIRSHIVRRWRANRAHRGTIRTIQTTTAAFAETDGMVFENFRIAKAGIAGLAGEQVFDVFVLRILHHTKFPRVQQKVFDNRTFRILRMIVHRNRLRSWRSWLTWWGDLLLSVDGRR